MCKQCEQYPNMTQSGALKCRYKTLIRFVGDFIVLLLVSAAILFLPLLVQFFGTLDFFTDSCGYGFMSKYFGYYINLYCGG